MKRKPRFYVSGVNGEYEVRERIDPYHDDPRSMMIMTTDQFKRARVVARALNENFPWEAS